jgi:hypothetical protein
MLAPETEENCQAKCFHIRGARCIIFLTFEENFLPCMFQTIEVIF